ncbi:p-loop containing nucleoside triphosphate hydrolase protein [Mycena kentingensis (nom. inval.)]|nr:p-loop containing nucleoside triphosphate hydrolase protein [Mycena kentingensis (nom. inval.)]
MRMVPRPQRHNAPPPALWNVPSRLAETLRRLLSQPGSRKTFKTTATVPDSVYLQLGGKTRVVPVSKMQQSSYSSVERYIHAQFPEAKTTPLEIMVDMDGRKDVILTEDVWAQFVQAQIRVTAYTIRLLSEDADAEAPSPTPPPYNSPTADADAFPFFIQSITGTVLPVCAKPFDTIMSLRLQIEGAWEVRPHRQQLIFRGKILDIEDSEKTVWDCGIREGETVHVVRRG